MGASFYLDAGINPTTGNGNTAAGTVTSTNNQSSGTTATAAIPAGSQGLIFNRRSTVEVSGGFGIVRLGRDYVPEFLNKVGFDPFSGNGTAQGTNLTGYGLAWGTGNTGPTAIRASNSVSYLWGIKPNSNPTGLDANGLFLQVMMAMGGNASNAGTATVGTSDGNYTGARIGYNGPMFNVAAATGTTKVMAVGDFTGQNIGGSYVIAGRATLYADYNVNKTGNNLFTASTSSIGAKIVVGKGYIPVSYNHLSNTGTGANGKAASQLGIGYVYNLSKRAAIYTTYARLNNTGLVGVNVAGAPVPTTLALANGGSTGFEIGLRTSF